ncbi:MAG: hypothetical protein ACOZD0_04410 [Pseudomonadota bacterium]
MADAHVLSIPLPGGGSAVINLPASASPLDLEMLCTVLESMRVHWMRDAAMKREIRQQRRERLDRGEAA